MSLNQRTAKSIGWQSGASVLRVVVLFGRSIMLARLLPIELFGIYASVNVLKRLTSVVAAFGLDGGLMHRSAATENEDEAASVHFTLKLISYLVWFTIMCFVAFIFFNGLKRIALLAVSFSSLISITTATPRIILRRRVVHRRLSLTNIVADIVSSLLAVAVAIAYPSIWALLITDLSIAIVFFVMMYLWKPVWKAKLSLTRKVVDYFVDFGKRLVGAELLLTMLDKLDDLWTSLLLGDVALGLYARAYTFSTYPRKIVATPVTAVALGSYAELKHDKEALSQMFFRINALLVRVGFILAGLLALVAPEFIRIAIGAKWLPFLDAFRLMMIFTLLDPIKATIGDLFIALGKPEIVTRTRLVQLVVLAVGLFTFGPRFGISGVAIAVNCMVVVGIVLLLIRAREYVDFSVVTIFWVPLVALFCGLAAGRGMLMIPGVIGSDWRTALVKVVSFIIIYGAVLLLFERKQTLNIIRMIAR